MLCSCALVVALIKARPRAAIAVMCNFIEC